MEEACPTEDGGVEVITEEVGHLYLEDTVREETLRLQIQFS